MLNKVKMQGGIVLYDIHIPGTSMTESVIDGISRGNNLVGMIQGLDTLQFTPLGLGVLGK